MSLNNPVLSIEDILEEMSDCVDSGFYFELYPDEARKLLEHIRELEEQVRMFGYETGPL